jgi:hypothetical protein
MVHNHCRWPAWTDSSLVGMEAHGRSRGRRTGDIGFTHRRSGGGGGRGRRRAAAGEGQQAAPAEADAARRRV